MKKILILIISLNIILADNNYEQKLYEKVLTSIFTNIPIRIYADNDTKEILKYSSKFKLVDHCDRDTLILVGKKFDNLDEVCKNKPIFATTYKGFKYMKNSFGAFYWRKGRPQIKFKKNMIDFYGLDLPESLRKYAK